MNQPKFGFIGGGRVVRILLTGWRHAGALPAQAAVVEPDAESGARLRAIDPGVTMVEDVASAASEWDCLFLAVHPPHLPEAAQPLAGALRDDAIVVSLAPKVSLAALSQHLGGFARLARCIPSAASIVGAGYNPVAFAAELDEPAKDTVLSLLAPLGESPVVPEERLEAYAVLSAMGPTYFWFQFDELRRLGQEFGLEAEAVDEALHAMVRGAASAFFGSGLSAADVVDLVPVRPLGSDEATIRAAYRQRLTDIFAKLTSH